MFRYSFFVCCERRELLVVGGVSAKEQVDALYSGVSEI